MLGIIIGIASVVSIVVVGDAAKQMVLADIRSIGTNTIDVYPGKDFGDDDPQYQQALKMCIRDRLRSVRCSPLVMLYTRPEGSLSQASWLASHMACTAFS